MFHRWIFGPMMCKVMTSLEVIFICASFNNFGLSNISFYFFSSFSFLVLVNLDRLYTLKFQKVFNRSMSVTSVKQDHKKMKIAIAICWVLALLAAAPMWFTSVTMWNDTLQRCDFPFRDVSKSDNISI